VIINDGGATVHFIDDTNNLISSITRNANAGTTAQVYGNPVSSNFR